MNVSSPYEQPLRRYHEPIGMRMIGAVDPRRLSHQEFQNAPDRLYHASRKAFELDPYLDYSETKNYADTTLGGGGLTLGAGLYTAQDRALVEDYLLVRSDGRGVIDTLLPYRANMLDLRDKQYPDLNGDVPKPLVDEWTELIRAKLNRIYQRQTEQKAATGMEKLMIKRWERYMARLVKIQDLGKTYELRTILATGDTDEARAELPEITATVAPPWITLWTKFMLHKGIDGIFYHEGGEGKNVEQGVTVVFYNPEKVGTYSSWHREQGHGAF